MAASIVGSGPPSEPELTSEARSELRTGWTCMSATLLLGGARQPLGTRSAAVTLAGPTVGTEATEPVTVQDVEHLDVWGNHQGVCSFAGDAAPLSDIILMSS